MSIEKEEARKFFKSAYRVKPTTAVYVLLLGLATTFVTLCSAAKQLGANGLQRGCKLEGLHPFLIVTYKNITISVSSFSRTFIRVISFQRDPSAEPQRSRLSRRDVMKRVLERVDAWNEYNGARCCYQVDKITVPHGEQVTVRCRELGKYKLVGDSLLHCRNASWSGKLPSCTPTTAISNYTEDVPPTIVFGLPAGSAAVEPSGALAVFPGSILHLECLFARKLGNPEWTWTSTFRQYLTGWAIAARERDWKYRLSIYYAKIQDSGVYTCSTPRGLSNSIRVHVVDVQCPVLNLPESPLIGKIEGARMGHGATFECPVGFRLEGAAGITCQYNGKWSAEMPRCRTIECPAIDAIGDTRLQLLEYNNTFGGRAVFACMWGHRLSGSQNVECRGNGSWSDGVPSCVGEQFVNSLLSFFVRTPNESDTSERIRMRYDSNFCPEIVCPTPSIPKSGRIVEQTNQRHDSARKQHRTRVYKVGALVRFACLPGHQLLGEASVICTENGTWSHPPPVCKVRCPYPGDPPHGRIAPLKFWYKPGDNIQVTCSPGYVTPLEPARKPTCRENGIWSAPPPPCRSYKDV